MYVGGIYIYDLSIVFGGKVRFKDILFFIEVCFYCVNWFCEKVICLLFDFDYFYWLNDLEFDIEYYVRYMVLL